ncbi:MAG: DUF72 domain-containing protein [Agriterribacter sp.]
MFDAQENEAVKMSLRDTNNSSIKIGTSNIVLPGPKTTFPEPFKLTTRLTYYASLFNTVELNSPFYKIPKASTFEKWSHEVPDDFEFTVKLWRGITHTAEWKNEDVDFFMQTIKVTRNKKGCLLVQFPASIKATYIKQVEKILNRISRWNRDWQWKLAVEFRDSGWYTQNVYDLLDHYHAAVVLHDMPASGTLELNKNASFVYLRFHGEKGDYKGSYSRQLLQQTAQRIQQWKQQGKQVYVYFNNTIGKAFENARTLQELCADDFKLLKSLKP